MNSATMPLLIGSILFALCAFFVLRAPVRPAAPGRNIITARLAMAVSLLMMAVAILDPLS